MTSTLRLHGDPAHFISDPNSAQFRPVSVVGLTGKRQPLGNGLGQFVKRPPVLVTPMGAELPRLVGRV